MSDHFKVVLKAHSVVCASFFPRVGCYCWVNTYYTTEGFNCFPWRLEDAVLQMCRIFCRYVPCLKFVWEGLYSWFLSLGRKLQWPEGSMGMSWALGDTGGLTLRMLSIKSQLSVFCASTTLRNFCWAFYKPVLSCQIWSVAKRKGERKYN